MYRIIDCHTHTYPEAIAEKASKNLAEFYRFTVAESGTFPDLLSCEREAGIGGFLLLPVATAAKNVDSVNRAAVEQVKRALEAGFEAASFGCMHPDYPDFRASLDYCLSHGLRGIKLHPDLQGVKADCDRLFSLYEIMQEKGMILWLHVGDDRPEIDFSSPERVANIAKTFPKLTVVAAHLGGYRVWDRAERILMGKFENLLYDCSSTLFAMSPERGKFLIEKCGTDRVMFGSDYPAISPAASLEGFLRLDFSEEVRQDILSRNIRRLLPFGDSRE